MLKVDDKEERGRWWVFGGRETEEGRLFWGGSSLKQMRVIFNVFFCLFCIGYNIQKRKKEKKNSKNHFNSSFFLCVVGLVSCQCLDAALLSGDSLFSFRFCFCFVALFPHLLCFLFLVK